MSDDPKEAAKPSAPTPEEEEWDAERARLIDNVVKALQEFEKGVRQHGFQRGWAAANQSFTKWLKEQVAQQAPEAPANQKPVSNAVLVRSPAKKRSAMEVILALLEEVPGRRGVELLRMAEERGYPLQERTLRTALFRLKTPKYGEKIVQVDGRWYLAKDAPAPSQPELKDTVMDPPSS